MSREDLLNNCDPPILPPDGGGGGNSGPGGPSGPGSGGGGGTGGRGRGGGGRGGSGGRPRPISSGPDTPSRPDSGGGGAGGGTGGSGGGGGGAGGGAGGGGGASSTRCNPFSGPKKDVNKGKGWSETPTQYAKIKGKDLEKRKACEDCEGSDGEGPNDEERFKDLTIYPHNKVTETESGHVVEYDDTPGSERISVNHRSGSFEEYHPNGDKVIKVVRDSYTSVLRDGHVHVDGYCDVTIDKAFKILVNTDEMKSTESNAVNFDIHVAKGANINIYIEKGHLNVLLEDGDSNIQLKDGDVNIRQDCGNYNHFINGDYNLECTGHMHVVVGEDQVTEIGRNRDVRVDGLFDNLQLTNGESVKETQLEGSLNTLVKGRTKEQFERKVERLYNGTRPEEGLVEKFEKVERTYKDSIEKYQSLSMKMSNTFTVEANSSVIRANKENYLMSLEGSAGIQAFTNIYVEAGVSETKGRNKDAVLRMYSENLSFIGGKKATNIFSRDSLRLSSLKDVTLFGASKLFKNKEFEDGGTFVANETPLATGVKRPQDPLLPTKFIECPPGKWIPTRQSTRCK